MHTIQIVLEEELLKAADLVVKRKRTNRSALIRAALREHLKNLRTRELEERDRWGYTQRPDHLNDLKVWDAEAAWPPEWRRGKR